MQRVRDVSVFWCLCVLSCVRWVCVCVAVCVSAFAQHERKSHADETGKRLHDTRVQHKNTKNQN